MSQETYVFTGNNYPVWFRELEVRGLIQYVKDPFGKVIAVNIKSNIGVQVAYINDLIIYDRGSVCVIKKSLMRERKMNV